MDDLFGIIFTVGVLDYAAVSVETWVLVDDPPDGAAVAKAVFVDLGGMPLRVRKLLYLSWVLSLERDIFSTRQLSWPVSVRAPRAGM